jgi:ribosomal-protein-alanine N-acetyltransferase
VSVIERILRREGDPLDDLSITPMRRRDLRHGVMEIEAASHPRAWSTSVFRSELDQARAGTRYYAVARRRRRIVGYAGLWFVSGEAHVTNVAVDPAERRTGVATRLLVDLVDEARRRGCRAWTLEVRVSSSGAQELYRGFGFAPAGVRKRYYENTEDALVMWCDGIQTAAYADRLEELRR